MQYEDGGKSVDEKLEKLKRPYDEDRPTIGQMLLEAAAEDRRRAKRQGALEALRDACGEIESIAWASLTNHPQLDPALRMQAEIQRRMKRRIEALEKQEESDANAGS